MYIKRRSFTKYFIAAAVGALVYCEWFIYLLQSNYWDNIKCYTNDIRCTKILLIADPQIQGDEAAPSPLNHLLSWDSDRYLKSTFSAVMKHFQPDILVYLGDLMDEGSIASTEQYHSYVERLDTIFKVDKPITQIWIPGDNDIGGENEPIKKDKVKEFEILYDQEPVITYRNITFFKVNGMTRFFPHITDGIEGNLKIVISHYPITSKQMLGPQVNNEIHPDIYFCAHDHQSKYIKQNKELKKKVTHWFQQGVLDIQFDNESLYEVFVPTCSYRMGTNSIGFGAAVLDNSNQHMRYTVFWSPQRFPYLVVYLIIALALTIYALLYLCFSGNIKLYKPVSLRTVGKD